MSAGARRAPERVRDPEQMYEETPYSKVIREVINSTKIKNLMKRVRRHTGKEETDQIQDFILLSLLLLQKYEMTEEEMISNRFKCLLRSAIHHDLLDELKPFRTTLPHGENVKVGSVSLGDFDPENDYSSEVNDTDGKVSYLPVIPCPEDSYILGSIIRKMFRTVPSSPAARSALGDLLANADLGEGARLKTYLSTHANHDRVPAKVICDAHGLTKHHRETFLRSAREYLTAEGVN
jgi:hypothetical protein